MTQEFSDMIIDVHRTLSAHHSVSITSLAVLAHMSKHPLDGFTGKNVADLVGTSVITGYKHLKRLEEFGYVKDQRITAEGMSVMRRKPVDAAGWEVSTEWVDGDFDMVVMKRRRSPETPGKSDADADVMQGMDDNGGQVSPLDSVTAGAPVDDHRHDNRLAVQDSQPVGGEPTHAGGAQARWEGDIDHMMGNDWPLIPATLTRDQLVERIGQHANDYLMVGNDVEGDPMDPPLWVHVNDHGLTMMEGMTEEHEYPVYVHAESDGGS